MVDGGCFKRPFLAKNLIKLMLFSLNARFFLRGQGGKIGKMFLESLLCSGVMIVGAVASQQMVAPEKKRLFKCC